MSKNMINPITKLDYPDVDVIRVENTYYMVSTTMHFMPGCEILRSYDLINWEHAAYLYDVLDSTPGQRLEGEENIYGRGMWAATLRFYKGRFYVIFVANDTHKTYLFTAPAVEGPWEKREIEGFYHDCSLLFDEDGKIYLVYGNRHIWLTEMKEDLSGPKEGGLHRMIVSDEGNPSLGYEGAHIYKINGKYYVFFIHSLRTEWKRVEACFVADSLEGEFVGGDVLNDDCGYCNAGVAQGGIVDTPEGDWYAILFQDRGAVGRVPVLLPVYWQDEYPVFGVDGKVPQEISVISTRPEYAYTELVQSDDFKGGVWPFESPRETLRTIKNVNYDSFGFKSIWQFNHEPELSLVERDLEAGRVRITTDKLCTNVTQAKNVLTQRMLFPSCGGSVTVDGSELKDGDYAGLCAFQGKYAQVALTREQGQLYVVLMARGEEGNTSMGKTKDTQPPVLLEKKAVSTTQVHFKIEVDFERMKDEAQLFYDAGEGWKQMGAAQKLYFRLDHFTGCRFGLFIYATQTIGGRGTFSEFIYHK